MKNGLHRRLPPCEVAKLCDLWRLGMLRTDLSYMTEFMKRKCAADLLATGIFPNAKEITESAAMREAAIEYLKLDPKDPNIVVLCPGDGSTPRTAALIAFTTKWRAVAVDPMLAEWSRLHVETDPARLTTLPPAKVGDRLVIYSKNDAAKLALNVGDPCPQCNGAGGTVGYADDRGEDEIVNECEDCDGTGKWTAAQAANARAAVWWRWDVKNVATERLEVIAKPVEAVQGTVKLKPGKRAVVLACHSHADLPQSVGVFDVHPDLVSVVAMPCCTSQRLGTDRPIDVEYVDDGVASPHRVVRVWRPHVRVSPAADAGDVLLECGDLQVQWTQATGETWWCLPGTASMETGPRFDTLAKIRDEVERSATTGVYHDIGDEDGE